MDLTLITRYDVEGLHSEEKAFKWTREGNEREL